MGKTSKEASGKKELLFNLKVYKQCVFGEQKTNCLIGSILSEVSDAILSEVALVLRLHEAFVHWTQRTGYSPQDLLFPSSGGNGRKRVNAAARMTFAFNKRTSNQTCRNNHVVAKGKRGEFEQRGHLEGFCPTRTMSPCSPGLCTTLAPSCAAGKPSLGETILYSS